MMAFIALSVLLIICIALANMEIEEEGDDK